MGNFNRDRRGGGNFRRGGFNNRGFDRPTMHQATCDKCRKECEVPFRPTNGKPVYCNNCFDRPTSKRPEGRDFYRSNSRNTEISNPQYDQQFALLNSKLDQVLNILMPIATEVETEVEKESAKSISKK